MAEKNKCPHSCKKCKRQEQTIDFKIFLHGGLDENDLKKELQEEDKKSNKYEALKKDAFEKKFPTMHWEPLKKGVFFNRDKYYLLMDTKMSKNSFKYLFSLLIYNPKSANWESFDGRWMGETIHDINNLFENYDYYTQITFDQSLLKCSVCGIELTNSKVYKKFGHHVSCYRCANEIEAL